jgi:Xaa-Pro aminopeptidase
VTARPTDLPEKRARLLGILDAAGADSLVLTSHGAVSWYLDGARVHTSLAGDPIAAVVVDRAGDTVVTSSNERARLALEELPAGPTVVDVPWHEPLSSAFPSGPGVIGETDVAADLRAARASLLPLELQRYRALCREVAEVATAVLHSVHPQTTEREAAAALASRLVSRGIDAVVLLVAGRARLGHRHPLPTDAPLGDRAMIVLCGRRHGLIANLTRWVRFGEATADELDADRRIREVEAGFFAATVAGAALSDAFLGGVSGYARHGFAPDEWRRHHQGGAAGYNGRDPRATAETADPVRAGQAFAWNPSAPGAKVEDTVLLTADGIDVLTVDPEWPTVTVRGVERPIELVRDIGPASIPSTESQVLP